jgi:cardiolipin synthase
MRAKAAILAIRAALLLAAGVVAGCGADALPPPDKSVAAMPLPGAAAPVIIGTDERPLPPEQRKAVLARLTTGGGESGGADALLERHLAIEAAVAGTPLVAGNRATLLRDGPMVFRAMMEAIRGARHHVNLEFFIIDPIGIGEEFADLLLAKRAEGVEINLIYDAVGSKDTPEAYFERLRAGGVRVLEFRPLNPLKIDDIADWNPNDRDHRKIVIVDGRVAFTGGINISTTYGDRTTKTPGPRKDPGPAPGTPWRDTCVRIEGPAVAEFQKAFLAQWREHGGEDLPDARFFPKVPPRGDAVVHVIVTDGKDGPPAFQKTVLSAFASATRRIDLTESYFAPPAGEIEALAAAARRGVKVRIVLPKITDQPKVVFASRANYQTLLDAGVEIYERRDVVLHAKTVSIDGVWSAVGSANLDYRSVLFNDEVVAVVIGREFGDAMTAMFEEDVAQSDRIDPAQWAERPAGDRIKEWLARLMQYWL